MKLSVVIPYHNADRWIGAMLDSLLDQDLPRTDYEIVVVDDGSTEEPVTLHRYVAQEPNIRCHRQENAGVAMARNKGLDLAKGEWIWFCDSDDYVQPQILGRLLAIADAQQLDMLWFNAVYVHEGRPVPAPKRNFDAVSAVQTGWDYMVHPPARTGMAMWRFLLRRDRVEAGALRFHDLMYMEGRWFQLELMPYIRRVAHVDVDGYYYVQRESSIMHAKKRKHYHRLAGEMEQYVEAMTAWADKPSVPEDMRTLLLQRRDFEAYRLLGNGFRYAPFAQSKAFYAKLTELGALPLAMRGGRAERLIRRVMNQRGLWLTVCRLYRLVKRPVGQVAALLCMALLAVCCSIRTMPEKGATDVSQPPATKVVEPVDVAALVRRDVPNEVYYKDIFLDAGIGLTARTSLFAADSLGLSLEGVSLARTNPRPDEQALQTAILSGTPDDENGRLLYPDGAPRYRVLFVCGGSSRTHAGSLDSAARAHMRQFVQQGGSYVGDCAGAFLAAKGYDSHADYPGYLALWPGVVQHTGLDNVYTGMLVEKNSPLLAYADFGGDGYINSIRHNKGGYPQSCPDGTEILARYDYPGKSSVHRQPSAWAYKPDRQTGRVVLEGSHPEEVRSGERLAFTEALIRYAADGVGTVSVKGILENGKPRTMDGSEKVGDLQCHHFATWIPAEAQNVCFTVESPVECDLKLRLCRDTYAFPARASHASDGKGPSQQLTLDRLEPGLWYVSVQCLTTVTVVSTEYGQEYTGRTDVLNGVPYTITVSWENHG